VAAKALPEGYSIAWSGQAFQEKRTGKQSAIAFGLAIVMVFLILAALYERWLLPFAVICAVPFAVLGALGFVAARVLGNGRAGVSSGDAIRAVEETAAKALPEGYSIAWAGQAFQEKRTGRQSAIAFGLAIVMVFLILAALYERWLLPFAVVAAVPFAVLGALSFVWARGLENDIYFQIGLVVLIGLAAKNAILIVEFAQQGFLAGKSATEAALNAARLRFRPIVMTSLAFVLGVMPLMLATGAGAGARRSMGTGVVGGMLAATFIATIFIPLFFVIVSRRRKERAAS
jgi:multidrug efflux pump